MSTWGWLPSVAATTFGAPTATRVVIVSAITLEVTSGTTLQEPPTPPQLYARHWCPDTSAATDALAQNCSQCLETPRPPPGGDPVAQAAVVPEIVAEPSTRVPR